MQIKIEFNIPDDSEYGKIYAEIEKALKLLPINFKDKFIEIEFEIKEKNNKEN